MNKTIILIISLFCGISSYGQLAPVYNIPSPEVANLGMYGNVAKKYRHTYSYEDMERNVRDACHAQNMHE